MSNTGGVYTWSRTAASNATADSTVNYSEGQAPSSLNDSARAAMASVAKYRDDIAGAIVTSGTSTAYTVSSFQQFDTLADMNGQVIAFSPHTTNGATVTINVDGLGGKPLRSAPNTELLAGVLIQGTPYLATYNNSDGAFYLRGFYGQPYQIPLGGMIEFTGTTAPNSSFVFPTGQAISRTTYAAYFAQVGTTYGVGDGSTTFNVIDMTGRVGAMKEAAATRLTSTYFGGNSTVLGAVGGAEKETLLTANLPPIPYTPSGTISGTTPVREGTGAAGSTQLEYQPGGGSGTDNIAFSGTFSGTLAALGGSSTPFATVQPTIIVNKILRII